MKASWPLDQDPHAQREASTYDNPVPSREYILACLKEAGKPMTLEQLSRAYAITDPDSLEALRRRLMAMERAGQLLSNRRRAYALIDKLNLIKGRVQAHRDGFGFLIPETGGEDLFIHPRQLAKVWDGDIVLARELGSGPRGKKEAALVEVISRGVEQLVGRLKFQKGGVALVIPENSSLLHEVLIPPEHLNGAEDGQLVQVEILEHPTPRRMVIGAITEVLGSFKSAGMEIEVALRTYNLPFTWPEAALHQAKLLPVEVTPEEITDRKDLRHLNFVTLDGEDAKDFDDAVYAEPHAESGWKLWVAIADVSHYVTPGSALDQEAYVRATSVYFPGRTLPMLPEALSNGLCSLNPLVDRLALVCQMHISAQGELSSYKFYPAVIKSKARLNYTEVGALFDEPNSPAAAEFKQTYPQLLNDLNTMHQLYLALRQARSVRGAIDFETRETRIVFNDDKKIDRIVPVVRQDSHKLIEEFMLCANVAAARYLEKNKLSALFRVHDSPKLERLETLRSFLGGLGLVLEGGDKPSPQDYQQLLSKIGERPDAEIIQTLMLRSMQQAVYSPENLGHFGLAYPAYAHFTSPIRRYPDLLVHRALTGAGTYSAQQMIALGEHCSMAERRADEAVRDVTDWLKCEFMQDKVGEVFQGKVTSVVGFGLFIELEKYFIEGLVHLSALPGDYYRFEPENQRLVGERSGRSYSLGDQVEVIVSRVNLEDRQIDFDLTASLEFDPSLALKKKTKKNKLKKNKASKFELNTVAPIPEIPKKKTSKKKKTRPGKKERAQLKAKAKK